MSVTLCFLAALSIAGAARIKSKVSSLAEFDPAASTQVNAIMSRMAGMGGAPSQIDVGPLIAAYRCFGPNVAHLSAEEAKEWGEFKCRGANDPYRVASASLFLASSVANVVGVSGIGNTLFLSSQVANLWDQGPDLEDVQETIASSVQEAARDLKTFRFERGLGATVAQSRLLSDRTEELIASPDLRQCNESRTVEWFSQNDRTDEDAQYALADALVHAKLFTETMPVNEDTSSALMKRQLEVADGLSSVWAALAMGRMSFLVQVSKHGKACPVVEKSVSERIHNSLLTASVGRYQMFSKVWTLHRESLSSGVKQDTLAKLQEHVAPNKQGERSVAGVARASGQLLLMGDEGVGTLKELLKDDDLAVVSGALEMRTYAEHHPQLLLPYVSELVRLVTTPFDGDDEQQFYMGHVETQAARLLEIVSQNYAGEMGWDSAGKLRSGLTRGIVRGQQSRSKIGTVIQRIQRDAAKTDEDPSAMMQLTDASSERQLAATADDGLNSLITTLSANVAGLGAAGTDLWGLLGTFNCEGYEEDGKMKFECAGANDYASIASAGLLLASAVATASGFGLPAITVLSIAGKVVGLWANRGPKLPEFQADVLMMIAKAVQDVKAFHLKYDLADAQAKSIVLTDHIDALKRFEAIEDCNSPPAVAWFSAVDRVDEQSAEAMAELLTQAELAATMRPNKKLGIEALKRYVEILDGFTSSWSNLAMGRLAFLTEAAEKSKKCERFNKHVEHRMRHTLLGSVTNRYRKHEGKFQAARKAYMDMIYDLEVAEIRAAVETWKQWVVTKLHKRSWFNLKSVASYSPQLVQLGKPGRDFLGEFLQCGRWKVVAAVFEEPTLEVLTYDKKLVLPLALDMAKVFLLPWQGESVKPKLDNEELALVGTVHSAVANVLDHIPARHLKEIKDSGIEDILKEALSTNNVRRRDAERALQRVIQRIKES